MEGISRGIDHKQQVQKGDGKRTTCNEMEFLGMKREKGRRREEREERGGGKKGGGRKKGKETGRKVRRQEDR